MSAKLLKIARLQFRKNVKPVVAQNSVVLLEIIVCSEFNDPIDDLIGSVKFQIHLVTVNGVYLCDSGLIPSTISIENNIARLKLTIPPFLGQYNILITNKKVCGDILVLPVMSDCFLIVDTCLTIGHSLLGCYRIFSQDFHPKTQTISPLLLGSDVNHKQLLIYEEYGATLGSHLYDSSAVLLRYLQQQERSVEIRGRRSNGLTVVELGAGCGLVGIWCAQALSAVGPDGGASSVSGQVFLTDLRCQESIIRRNVILNCSSSDSMSCHFRELDWSSELHASTLLDAIRDSSSGDGEEVVVDLILATDVLYDKGAAALLFKLLKKIGTPGATRILLAQKLRDSGYSGSKTSVAVATRNGLLPHPRAANMTVDVQAEEGFAGVRVVHEEADVVVWEMEVM